MCSTGSASSAYNRFVVARPAGRQTLGRYGVTPMGVSRRWVLSRGAALATLFVGGCTIEKRDDATPTTSTGGESASDGSGSFGGEVVVGPRTEVNRQIVAEAGALYVPVGRCWLVDSSDGDLVAIYQKCTHLGCRVPYCSTSRWFECPCHNSVFDGMGEYVSGPAPRSLDRFPVRTANDVVVIDTSTFVEGKDASLGPSTAQPAGPHCVR